MPVFLLLILQHTYEAANLSVFFTMMIAITTTLFVLIHYLLSSRYNSLPQSKKAVADKVPYLEQPYSKELRQSITPLSFTENLLWYTLNT